MRNKILTAFLIMLLVTSVSMAAMTYGAAYYKAHRQTALSTNSGVDPLYLFMNEVEDTFGGGGYIQFTPASEPTGAEGLLYYDDTANALKLYTGSAWVDVDTAGGVSLDGAYDLGVGITVDAGAVTLTATNAANNVALAIVQSDTSTSKAMTITNAGTGNSIDIQGQSSAKDIEGTDDTWSVSTAGVGTYVGIVAGTSGVVLQNGEIISNGTNDTILFNTGDEDLSLDFTTGANTITLGSNSTGGTTIALGDYSTITGISALTGLAADFTISTTGDATGEDLIISQDGTGDNQVIIQSAGTAANAIAIQSSKGIDIDAVDDLTITNTASTAADDFIITQAGAYDASLILTSGGTGADALSLITSHADGDIKINSGDKLDIDAADAITIDCLGAAGEDITVTNTGGSIQVVATESASDAVVITASGAAGGITLASGTGDITLDSGDDIFLAADTSTGDVISIINTQGTAAGATILRSVAGGVDIDAAAALDVDISGGQVLISSKDNAANAIALTANVGSSETITITNTKGTNAASIGLVSTVGGITATSSAGLIALNAVGATAGDITITSGDDFLATSTGKTDLTSAESSTITAPAINLLGQINLGTVHTFTDSDATPDVTGYTYWNTNTTTATITDFDGAGLASGQLLVVVSKGTITFDVTSSGIKGGTTDIVTAAGDATMFIYDGTDWLVVARMDMSDDLN
jgi:hypothetical protein